MKAMGAETLILGCTGMAHHRRLVQQEVGLPVIDPGQAGAAAAIAAVVADLA